MRSFTAGMTTPTNVPNPDLTYIHALKPITSNPSSHSTTTFLTNLTY